MARNSPGKSFANRNSAKIEQILDGYQLLNRCTDEQYTSIRKTNFTTSKLNSRRFSAMSKYFAYIVWVGRLIQPDFPPNGFIFGDWKTPDVIQKDFSTARRN